MQHWINAIAATDHIVKDVQLLILRILARLDCIKFFISMGLLDFISIDILQKFDVIRGQLVSSESNIRQIFSSGIIYQCMYKGEINQMFIDHHITTFDRGISVFETSFMLHNNIKIYDGIPTVQEGIAMHAYSQVLFIQIECAAEIYKLDIDCDHICIDVYKKL